MRSFTEVFPAFQLHGLRLRELAWQLYGEFNEDNALGLSAQLAFYAVLSIFPFFIFLLTLVAYLPIPDLSRRVLGYINLLMPGTAGEMIRSVVMPIVAQRQGGLLTVSLLGALWSASSAMSTFMEVMNQAFEARETRSWLKRKALAIGLTLVPAALILVASVLLMTGPSVVGWITRFTGLGEAVQVAWLVLRWPVIIVLVIFAFNLLYYAAPDRPLSWHWVTPGSVLATLLWIVLSLCFAFYVSNFGAYNQVYGFIGAVIVLMLWLWLSGLAAIIGAELNAELEQAGRSHP